MLFMSIVALALAMAVGSLMWKAMSRYDPQQPQRTTPTRTIAPDDDPEFLRRLGEKLRSEDGDQGRPAS
jgi:hypothetical protein